MQSRSAKALVSVILAFLMSVAVVIVVTLVWVATEVHGTAVALPPGSAVGAVGWDPVSFFLSERIPIVALGTIGFAASFAAIYRRLTLPKSHLR